MAVEASSMVGQYGQPNNQQQQAQLAYQHLGGYKSVNQQNIDLMTSFHDDLEDMVQSQLLSQLEAEVLPRAAFTQQVVADLREFREVKHAQMHGLLLLGMLTSPHRSFTPKLQEQDLSVVVDLVQAILVRMRRAADTLTKEQDNQSLSSYSHSVVNRGSYQEPQAYNTQQPQAYNTQQPHAYNTQQPQPDHTYPVHNPPPSIPHSHTQNTTPVQPSDAWEIPDSNNPNVHAIQRHEVMNDTTPATSYTPKSIAVETVSTEISDARPPQRTDNSQFQEQSGASDRSLAGSSVAASTAQPVDRRLWMQSGDGGGTPGAGGVQQQQAHSYAGDWEEGDAESTLQGSGGPATQSHSVQRPSVYPSALPTVQEQSSSGVGQSGRVVQVAQSVEGGAQSRSGGHGLRLDYIQFRADHERYQIKMTNVVSDKDTQQVFGMLLKSNHLKSYLRDVEKLSNDERKDLIVPGQQRYFKRQGEILIQCKNRRSLEILLNGFKYSADMSFWKTIDSVKVELRKAEGLIRIGTFDSLVNRERAKTQVRLRCQQILEIQLSRDQFAQAQEVAVTVLNRQDLSVPFRIKIQTAPQHVQLVFNELQQMTRAEGKFVVRAVKSKKLVSECIQEDDNVSVSVPPVVQPVQPSYAPSLTNLDEPVVPKGQRPGKSKAEDDDQFLLDIMGEKTDAGGPAKDMVKLGETYQPHKAHDKIDDTNTTQQILAYLESNFGYKPIVFPTGKQVTLQDKRAKLNKLSQTTELVFPAVVIIRNVLRVQVQKGSGDWYELLDTESPMQNSQQKLTELFKEHGIGRETNVKAIRSKENGVVGVGSRAICFIRYHKTFNGLVSAQCLAACFEAMGAGKSAWNQSKEEYEKSEKPGPLFGYLAQTQDDIDELLEYDQNHKCAYQMTPLSKIKLFENHVANKTLPLSHLPPATGQAADEPSKPDTVTARDSQAPIAQEQTASSKPQSAQTDSDDDKPAIQIIKVTQAEIERGLDCGTDSDYTETTSEEELPTVNYKGKGKQVQKRR